ncbi:peptidoglycan-binding protein [Nereida sp. NH-UV-3]|uniref:peptidoglycan-binding protein n=1 Tax=Nereida TaxID=282198 RepID=UPI0036F26862
MDIFDECKSRLSYSKGLALVSFVFCFSCLLPSQIKAQSVSSYSDALVCTLAVKVSNGTKRWGTTSSARVFRAEARKRGINCKVPKAQTRTTVLSKRFASLTKEDRLQVQTNLAHKGLYTSSVDGLYGVSTRAALKAYNKEYRANKSLKDKTNVDGLLTSILKDAFDEEAQNKTVRQAPEVEVLTPEPKPKTTTKGITQLLALYEAKEYAEAFSVAQRLAAQGNDKAQFILGKLYADGRGTIQVRTIAHMWFNIASMNGSGEAYEQRDKIAGLMSPNAVEEAQELALQCIQSKYSDCGLAFKPEQEQPAAITIKDGAVLGSLFKAQTILRRKQLQYALKKLGLYSSTVDGLWGSGTSRAFTNYIQINDLNVRSDEEVFTSVLSKVDVPSFFAAPKRKVVKRQPTKPKITPNTSGLTAIIGNPTLPATQAIAICRPQARQAERQAERSYRPIDFGSSANCSGFGNSINCNISKDSGGFLGGFADGLAKSRAGKDAKKAAMSSCLAQYGWRE